MQKESSIYVSLHYAQFSMNVSQNTVKIDL